MDNFLNRLNRNPYQPIDSASITRVDELGNGYDDWNNLIAPKFEAPEQTWGETALGVATAPARMATALAGSLSPYGADGWQVPPIVHEGVNALTAVGDAYNYGMDQDEINSRALGMAGFMMGGGGLAAKSPVSRAANLFPDQPRAMSADLFAEAVPAGERFGARTAAADPRQSKHWPSWGDREPDRAAAHVREQEAADAWFSIVDPIMYDERGLKRMERHEAEALAIERFPDALDKGFAYKEAAKAWNEIDKGRPMTAAEQAWFDLDLAPGRARTSRNEIMRDIVMPNMIMPDGSTGVQHMAAANGPKKLYSNASKEGAVPAIAGALGQEQKGITAYHGSPHDFDKFDLSKIGTGEGAQAYGHGLYFAENEGVAKSYRTALSDNWTPQMDFRKNVRDALRSKGHSQTFADHAVDKVERAIKDGIPAQDVLSSVDRMAAPDLYKEQMRMALSDAVPYMEQYPKEAGKMYQVRINADPNDFLDWEKPTNQWPAKANEVLDGYYQNNEIRQKYPDATYFLKSPEGTERLREAGIPGIRYLDQMSRNAGDGTRNYVVFDDSLVEILKKYGWLVPGAGYGANALSQGQENQY
jgi:hypothetical protein